MLDNPIWSALSTNQAPFAHGDERAKRFPADLGPFIAIGEENRESLASMGCLAEPGEVLNTVGVVPTVTDGWQVEKEAVISQMVFEGTAPSVDEAGVTVLGDDDLAQMLDLTALTFPGYFRSRTIEMGVYLGIHHEGRLIAMAGQRFCMSGYQEISGVCTHPDFRGRGHAGRLVALLVARILRDGMTPFLHVDAGNSTAKATYAKAGFAWRRDLKLLRLRREATP